MKANLAILLFAVASTPALADVGSTATVTVAGGPHAGEYRYSSDDPCILAALPGKPVGFALTVVGEKSSLTLDIPNAASPKQLQIELVVADVKPGQSRKNTASVTYTIDTRPDTSLEAYQKAERKGMTGQGSATLAQQSTTARLTFTGSTANGTRLSGTVDCRKIDREYAR
jgi:hypothetical protein